MSADPLHEGPAQDATFLVPQQALTVWLISPHAVGYARLGMGIVPGLSIKYEVNFLTRGRMAG